jgi:uridine kinase
VGEFLKLIESTFEAPVVGAIVNGEIRELTFPITKESEVRPVTMNDADGMRIYRRSLTFLLETAFSQMYPGAKINIDHSVSFGGYYCRVINHAPLSQRELSELEGCMREIVSADLPFIRQEHPLAEAIELFRLQGDEDRVRLLTYRKKTYLTVYRLADHWDYHHGYMVPSAGFLKWFKLSPAGEGFTLRFPRRSHPTQILDLPDYPTLLKSFRQYGDWLVRLGISSVGSLNDAIQNKRIHEVILVSEALHEQHISDIATQITTVRDRVRVIVVAGPTSSGKTTFSKRLSVQLLANGLVPFPLELDNYFIDRDLTPLAENGKPDFESIKALNLARLGEDVRRLIAGEKVAIPRYDFKAGKQREGEAVQIGSSELLIIEGIHGLNPKLIPGIPAELTYRIYVSALTQLNLDHQNRVSTTDTRLLRRIVRDANYRGYTAQQTISNWESVRRGEKNYIFPYQENANIMFNSALVYEVSALKPLAEPLLRQVPFGTDEYIEAKRLLSFLEWFLPIETAMIPDNSILREFIGESILHDFRLWHNHNHVDSGNHEVTHQH